MAGGEVIGAAISILLLILVGYVIVGATLSSAEIVTSAQKDVAIQTDIRTHTNIEILNSPLFESEGTTPLTYKLTFKIKNTGREVISDFNHFDVFLAITEITPTLPSNAPVHLSYDDTSGHYSDLKWKYTDISGSFNPTILDPDETMTIVIDEIPISALPQSSTIAVATSNGASDLYTLYP